MASGVDVFVRLRGAEVALFVFVERAIAACGNEAFVVAPGLGRVAGFALFDLVVSAEGLMCARRTATVSLLEGYVGGIDGVGHVSGNVGEVAFFFAADEAVAARGCTRAGAHVDEAGEREFKGRAALATFCVEHLEGVDAAGIHAERLGPFFCKSDGLLPVSVDAGEFEGEVPVEEDPHIVVASEGEGFAAIVFEVGLEFGGKEAVCGFSDAVERSGVWRVEAFAIEGPEIRVGVSVVGVQEVIDGFSIFDFSFERQRRFNGEGHAGVFVPVVEDFRTCVEGATLFVAVETGRGLWGTRHFMRGSEDGASFAVEVGVDDVGASVVAVAAVSVKVWDR